MVLAFEPPPAPIFRQRLPRSFVCRPMIKRDAMPRLVINAAEFSDCDRSDDESENMSLCSSSCPGSPSGRGFSAVISFMPSEEVERAFNARQVGPVWGFDAREDAREVGPPHVAQWKSAHLVLWKGLSGSSFQPFEFFVCCTSRREE